MGTIKQILERNIKEVHTRRYEVLDIITNYDGFIFLKQVVNALNYCDDLLNKWLFISNKLDVKDIYNKAIGYYNKYNDFEHTSYLHLYNEEIVGVMFRLIRSLDNEQKEL